MLGQQAQQLPPALSPGGCSVVCWGRAIATRRQGRGQRGSRGKGVAGAVQRGGQQEGTGQEGEGPEHNDLCWGLHRRRAEALREGEAGQRRGQSHQQPSGCPLCARGSGQGPPALTEEPPVIRGALNSHALLASFLAHPWVPLTCLVSGPSLHRELLWAGGLCCHILYSDPSDPMVTSSFKHISHHFQVIVRNSYCVVLTRISMNIHTTLVKVRKYPLLTLVT